jgi:amino acid adenylation domain-containing protein
LNDDAWRTAQQIAQSVWGRTVRDYVPALSFNQATSLFDLFFASRRAYGNRPALWVEGRTLTYAELYDAAARLAGVIRVARGHGARHQQFQCGLLVNRTSTAYASVLASLLVGSAYVPLNPKFPRDRVREVLSSSAVDIIIVDHRSVAIVERLLESFPRPLTVLLPDSNLPVWAGRSHGHRYIARSEIEGTAPIAPTTERSSEDGAYLLFTSGSTGTPKGVLISHANALAYITNASERYRAGPQDRFSQLFDFSFDLSVHDMFLAWGAGACLYCAPKASLAGFGDFIRRCGLTFWFSVPSTAAFMRQLRMLKPGSYPTLRWSLFCGEALPVGLARTWQEAAPNSIVENLYGPTEATVAFTAYRLSRERRSDLDAMQTVPIGMPLPGQTVMVVDEDGKPLQNGEAGELCLGGSQVAAGYWRAPDQTLTRFKPPGCAGATGMRWYRTGDRAVMSSEHGLLFLGRMDRQVKIRGHRVELLEVENAIRAAAKTDMVAAVPSAAGDDGLVLCIVGLVAGSQKSPEEIIDRCRETLPSYMVPSQIYKLADWPLNASGKTDYSSLTKQLHNVGFQLQ